MTENGKVRISSSQQRLKKFESWHCIKSMAGLMFVSAWLVTGTSVAMVTASVVLISSIVWLTGQLLEQLVTIMFSKYTSCTLKAISIILCTSFRAQICITDNVHVCRLFPVLKYVSISCCSHFYRFLHTSLSTVCPAKPVVADRTAVYRKYATHIYSNCVLRFYL